MPRQTTPMVVNRKVAVLGFRAVGKTSLTTQFIEGRFLPDRYDPTIENTYRKTIRFKKIHFSTEIVDTAGMDEYARLSRNASVGVHGYVMCYSTTSRQSFEKIKHINDMLLNMLADTPDIPRILVGSMVDLGDQRQVQFEEGQSLADQWGIPFLECSAKQNLNIAEIFTTLMKEIERDNGLFGEDTGPVCCII